MNVFWKGVGAGVMAALCSLIGRADFQHEAYGRAFADAAPAKLAVRIDSPREPGGAGRARAPAPGRGPVVDAQPDAPGRVQAPAQDRETAGGAGIAAEGAAGQLRQGSAPLVVAKAGRYLAATVRQPDTVASAGPAGAFVDQAQPYPRFERGFYTTHQPLPPIPEPSLWAMLLAGLAVLGAGRRFLA